MASRRELLSESEPRRFQLFRREDVNGMSGTGIVAEGIQFRDGRCAYRWLTEPSTTQLADSIHDIEHIHGHGGRTTIRWLDEDGDDGEKSLAEVYADRNRLAVAFAMLAEEAATMQDGLAVPDRFNGYGGGWHIPTDEDDAAADEWAVVWANLPTGLVSWHVPADLPELTALSHCPVEFDGHTRQDKNDRLLNYAARRW